MNYGYVKIYRQIQDSFLWTDKPFSRGQAWIDLLLLANFQDSSILIRGLQINIKRGQLAYSQVSLGKRWGWGKTKVENFLKLLIFNKQINVQNNNVTTLISILNYDIYQSDQPPDQIPNNSSINCHTIVTPDSQHNELQLQVIKDNKEELINEKFNTTFTLSLNGTSLNFLLSKKFCNDNFKKALTVYFEWYYSEFNEIPKQVSMDIAIMNLSRMYTCDEAIHVINNNIKNRKIVFDTKDYHRDMKYEDDI